MYVHTLFSVGVRQPEFIAAGRRRVGKLAREFPPQELNFTLRPQVENWVCGRRNPLSGAYYGQVVIVTPRQHAESITYVVSCRDQQLRHGTVPYTWCMYVLSDRSTALRQSLNLLEPHGSHTQDFASPYSPLHSITVASSTVERTSRGPPYR